MAAPTNMHNLTTLIKRYVRYLSYLDDAGHVQAASSVPADANSLATMLTDDTTIGLKLPPLV